MERFAVFVWEGGYSWLCEVTGRHGSNVLPFRDPSAIEFLVRTHWETTVLGQILAGRPREVTGANFCHWRPLGRRLNSSSGIIGKGPFWAKVWPGGHGRSREVIGGYGRLRAVTERENGEQWRKSRKKVGDTRRKGRKCQVSSVDGGVWSGKCCVECRV